MSIENFIKNCDDEASKLRAERQRLDLPRGRKGVITRKLNEISKLRAKASRRGLDEVS